jgi:hypothetical protein
LATRWHVGAALVLALSAHLEKPQAQALSTYLESSGTQQKPRSNAGFSVQGDKMRIRAEVALRGRQQHTATDALQLRTESSTEVVPSLRSAFKLAKNLNLESGVSFAEWNASSSTQFDARLRYRKPLHAFFDELDGSLWRSPEGSTAQKLRLGFHESLPNAGTHPPVTISGEATYEATQSAAAQTAESRSKQRVRIEARVAGLMPEFLGANHAVGLKLEKAVSGRAESASALTYTPSWTPGSLTKLGLNVQLRRETYSAGDDFAPSIDFSWRSKF